MRGCRRGLTFSLLLVAMSAFGQQDQTPAPSAASPTSTSADQAVRAPASGTDASQTRESARPSPDLTPDANGALSQEQMRALTRVVAENYRANYKKQRDYTYIEHKIQKKLDGKGQVKSTEVRTYEVMAIYGEQFERLIEKDDKPLSEKDAAQEEARIQREVEKRKNESQEERTKRHVEEEKQREKNREFVSDVADAYNFRLVGSELLNGRDAWVIAGEPRPGFEPHGKAAQFLAKFHGRMWIDKSDTQLVKLDVEAMDTVSMGWVLARIHKGTRLVYEQTRVNDEVWLPEQLNFKLDARVALFKGYNEESEQTYRNYRKFRTEVRVVGVGEVREEN
jgi:hypothetical protein